MSKDLPGLATGAATARLADMIASNVLTYISMEFVAVMMVIGVTGVLTRLVLRSVDEERVDF